MKCLLVTKNEDGQIVRTIADRPTADLPPGDVLVQVRHSSLNYKDALAATGHPGVVDRFPHVPGIDAAGVVIESGSKKVSVGDEVIVTSYDLVPAAGEDTPNSSACPPSGLCRCPPG